MADNDEKREPRPVDDDQWVFPDSDGGGHDENESDAAETEFVTLCVTSVSQATSLRERLESEGVACRLHPEIDSSSPEIETSQIEVLVLDEDLEVAHFFLHSPEADGDIDDDDDDDDDSRDEDYFAEKWICPRCRCQTLDLLPLSITWQRIRISLWAVIILPLSVAVLAWAFPSLDKFINRLPEWWFVCWVGAVLILASLVTVAHRDKRCSKCGWQSDSRNPNEEEATDEK